MTYKKDFFRLASSYEEKIIARYKGHIELQNKILKKVASSLPDHLSNRTLFCVISGKKIILYTDSATWSSQLRFYTNNMLQAVQASKYGNYEKIKIKIIPKKMERDQQKPLKLPSVGNINFILNQAGNQKDEKLKKALLKLGTTFNRLSKKKNEVSY